jgi:hypothetical protein
VPKQLQKVQSEYFLLHRDHLMKLHPKRFLKLEQDKQDT